MTAAEGSGPDPADAGPGGRVGGSGRARPPVTPAQRDLLRRVAAEGPLVAVRPWEMVTVRALLRRGLLRRKDPERDGRRNPGLWFLTEAGARAIPARRGGSA